MINKKGQLNNFEDYFKAFITLIFGIIFLFAIIEVVPTKTIEVFKDLGFFLIVVGVITLIISLIPRRYFR
jgi:hypothetical protein